MHIIHIKLAVRREDMVPFWVTSSKILHTRIHFDIYKITQIYNMSYVCRYIQMSYLYICEECYYKEQDVL